MSKGPRWVLAGMKLSSGIRPTHFLFILLAELPRATSLSRYFRITSLFGG